MLPVFADRATAYEIVFEDRELDPDEADELALVQARDLALGSVPADAAIINQYSTIRTENGIRSAYVVITTEEIIGRTEEVPNDG